MTQLEAAAEPTAFAAWRALGMLIQLVVTDPGQLPAARRMLADDLAELDAACSRFRPDSELVTLGSAAMSTFVEPWNRRRTSTRKSSRAGRWSNGSWHSSVEMS